MKTVCLGKSLSFVWQFFGANRCQKHFHSRFLETCNLVGFENGEI